MSEMLTSALPKTKRDLLTYDDYVTFPDSDGIRKEIIEGELFMIEFIKNSSMKNIA